MSLHILTSCYHHRFEFKNFIIYVFQVVFAGDAAVGKTSFINRITKGVFIQDVSSTLGVDFQIKVLDNFKKEVANKKGEGNFAFS